MYRLLSKGLIGDPCGVPRPSSRLRVLRCLFPRSSVSTVIGLPCEKVSSAPAIIVSVPAHRSLTLCPTRTPSHLVTLSTESSDSFVVSAAASIATGWNEPVPGRELHPLKSSAFHGALFYQLSCGVPSEPLLRPG